YPADAHVGSVDRNDGCGELPGRGPADRRVLAQFRRDRVRPGPAARAADRPRVGAALAVLPGLLELHGRLQWHRDALLQSAQRPPQARRLRGRRSGEEAEHLRRLRGPGVHGVAAEPGRRRREGGPVPDLPTEGAGGPGARAAGPRRRQEALRDRRGRLVTRPVITYSGPVEAAEVVREVAGARFDIQTVPPETDAVASGLKNASAFLDASMKVRLTEAMIAAAPDLRLVVTA